MNIYYIKHNGRQVYDSHDSHVIIANNEKEVIKFAKVEAEDEGEKIWETATITNQGTYTGEQTKPFILISSFNAG